MSKRVLYTAVGVIRMGFQGRVLERRYNSIPTLFLVAPARYPGKGIHDTVRVKVWNIVQEALYE